MPRICKPRPVSVDQSQRSARRDNQSTRTHGTVCDVIDASLVLLQLHQLLLVVNGCLVLVRRYSDVVIFYRAITKLASKLKTKLVCMLVTRSIELINQQF